MQTSEVLNTAADLIEERGWSRISGWDGEGVGLCLEGGIQAAAGVQYPHQLAACPAYEAVLDYLGRENCVSFRGNTHLWVWNDTYGRTAEQVIATLRAAALIAAAQETAASEVARVGGLA